VRKRGRCGFIISRSKKRGDGVAVEIYWEHNIAKLGTFEFPVASQLVPEERNEKRIGPAEAVLVKAQRYRDQAISLRELARKEDNLTMQKALVQLAESYERLCEKLVMDAANRSPTG
jgi:hypothetical protein